MTEASAGKVLPGQDAAFDSEVERLDYLPQHVCAGMATQSQPL